MYSIRVYTDHNDFFDCCDLESEEIYATIEEAEFQGERIVAGAPWCIIDVDTRTIVE
jgi:hypothetical protein